MDALDADAGQPNAFTSSLGVYSSRYQAILDRSAPYGLYRWAATATLILVFFLRIILAQAFFILCYGLGIYLLNLFLAFLQPKFDPSLAADLAESEVEEGAPGLPTSMPSSYADLQDGEFRPFIRRLPEFKFWYSATKAVFLTLVATLFPFLDIPVYWPILLVYFCVLFVVTMRRQIVHMRKWKYLPFDIGRKTTYNGLGNGSRSI